MDIKEFMKIDKMTEFDFVIDTIDDEQSRNLYCQKDTFERWFLYQYEHCKNTPFEATCSFMCSEDKAELKNVDDPDSKSALLQNIYKAIWPTLCKQLYMKKDDNICSDTMTSFNQRFNDFWGLKMDEDFGGKKIYELKRQVGNKNVSKKFLVELYLQDKDRFKELCKLGEEDSLEEFLKYYHTIGNYCPVPLGFNISRSGTNARYDYWDLTLMKIQEYYLNPAEAFRIISVELLHRNGDGLACKEWLDYFGSGLAGWKSFVEMLFMKPYVNLDSKQWTPEPLYEGHSWENYKPQSLEEFKQLFKNTQARIEKRGIMMVKHLKLRDQA